MSTITRERIEQLANGNNICKVTREERIELARIALASLEAEPAIHRWRRVTVEPYGPYPWHYGNFIGFSKPVEGIEDEYYYSATPAPVSVKDHQIRELVNELRDIAVEYHGTQQLRERIARTVRAAMLQGADGNSPVIPDGWKLVPVEPTAEMLQSGISAHYERNQIQIHDRSAPGPMECAYVAMLAAAPHQGAEPVTTAYKLPEGYALVPVEPTYQMCEAMGLPWESPRFPDRYKSMLSAAPKQEDL